MAVHVDYNVFRVLGDVSHTLSKFILIWAIHSNRSAEGDSSSACKHRAQFFADPYHRRLPHHSSSIPLSLRRPLCRSGMDAALLLVLELLSQDLVHKHFGLHPVPHVEGACSDAREGTSLEVGRLQPRWITGSSSSRDADTRGKGRAKIFRTLYVQTVLG